MFRNMRRFKQQLEADECIGILKSEPRGVLAVLGDDDYPYTIPMDFIFEEGKIYFHCAKEGHKIDAILKYDKVSFCVYDKGFIKDGDWALNIRSVIVFGKIKIVDDEKLAIEKMRNLGYKYFPDKESSDKVLEKHAQHALCLELTIEHMTGKLVNES